MAGFSLPDWRRAHGPPLFAARLRTLPQDFEVTERLAWDVSGDGEHDYLWIEKAGANTDWVARALAKHARVPARDIGFAGLKDRHAVTRQWFSVPRWHAPDWSTLDVEGVRIVDTQRHLRKLRRGAHAGNAFRILLRCSEPLDTEAVKDRLQAIHRHGVPNYFGEQRFGRHAGNLQLADAWASGKRLPRQKRSLAISTVRSYVFNEVLSERVHAGSWNRLLSGDLANLDGTGSVFEVTDVDDALRRRCEKMDVHPAAVLVGAGAGIDPPSWQGALDAARVEPGTRALRLAVRKLTHEFTDAGLRLAFELDRGAFATSVLRELCEASAGQATTPGDA